MGQVFNPKNFSVSPDMFEFAQAPSMLDFDWFFRIYFTSRPRPDRDGQYVSRLWYADFDKKFVTKVVNVASQPILSLGGLGEFDEFGTYPASMIKDGQRILAYYAGWTRCESVPFNVSIGLAESDSDGDAFNRVGCGPINSYSLDEPFVMSGPKIRKYDGVYYLFYIAGRKWKMVSGRPEPVYKIRLATSSDGRNWQKINKDLIQFIRGRRGSSVTRCDLFQWSLPHVLCYRRSANYRNRENGYRIGYARSNDLYNLG